MGCEGRGASTGVPRWHGQLGVAPGLGGPQTGSRNPPTCYHLSASNSSPTKPAHLGAKNRVAACSSLLRAHLDLHTREQSRGQQVVLGWVHSRCAHNSGGVRRMQGIVCREACTGSVRQGPSYRHAAVNPQAVRQGPVVGVVVETAAVVGGEGQGCGAARGGGAGHKEGQSRVLFSRGPRRANGLAVRTSTMAPHL